MVMTTLHTADTVEAILRLVDLGVEPWVIGNSLTAVLAQRLVRAPCPKCMETAKIEVDVKDGDDMLLPKGSIIARPRGCTACLRTGYRGRSAIFELLAVDDDLRELIKSKGGVKQYREYFRRKKLQSLRRAGMEKVRQGLTTVDEVLRQT
jgi:type II secretory ATPase GspE/PulE/Tfp pilus assembly ATPase PilB-like protein